MSVYGVTPDFLKTPSLSIPDDLLKGWEAVCKSGDCHSVPGLIAKTEIFSRTATDRLVQAYAAILYDHLQSDALGDAQVCMRTIFKQYNVPIPDYLKG